MPLIVLVTTFLFSFFFTGVSQIPGNYMHDQVEVLANDQSNIFMSNDPLFEEEWDQFNETRFWKKIMLLSNDSLVLNIAATREVLEVVSTKAWNAKSSTTKEAYRNQLRKEHGLGESERIYATSGKNNFYHFDLAIPTISKGIEEFEENDVDPWYAQAILLIESPGQLKKSTTGAYGPFQLMPGVARNFGLTVNRSKDERKDFERSAYAASSLIKTICIPEAKKILDDEGVCYEENELWFRLFVLHVYHAGAGNVKAVVQKIAPEESTGKELINSMWHTKAAHFGNNSQNYSQLALASQMILQEKLEESAEVIYYCQFP